MDLLNDKALKSTVRATAIAGLLTAALVPAAAAQNSDGFPGEISANVTFASEYVFRGVSVSDEDPALQGSLTWAHGSGFYIGAWGSSGNFGTNGSLEIDYYAGYGTDLNGVTLDFSVIYYTYPGDEADGNYWEVMAKAGYDLGLIAVTGGVAYVPSGQDAYGGKDAVYVFSDAEVPIPNTPVTLGLHIGYEDFGDRPSKLDWSAGLYTTIWGVDLGLAYVDTDLDARVADSRVLFTIGKSF